MGLHPHIALVMAITDLKTENYRIVDPRWHAPDDWLDLKIPIPDMQEIQALEDVIKNESLNAKERDDAFVRLMRLEAGVWNFKGKDVYDAVVWDAEYGLPNVLGVVISELKTDDYCLWALDSILAEHGVMQACTSTFLELPLWPVEKDMSEPALWWRTYQTNPELVPQNRTKMVQNYQRKLERRWNYGSGLSWLVEVFGDKAMYLLQDVLGMDITEKELRLGIYWLWS